jgi:hypothetical protein
VRCASCEFLYYPQTSAAYLCEVCQSSLEDYVRSLPGHPNATVAWWQRQQCLRAARS